MSEGNNSSKKETKNVGVSRCGCFIAPDEYCEKYYGHEGRCGLMANHDHWFSRDGFCVICGKDGGMETYGP